MRRSIIRDPYLLDDLPDLVEARAFVLGYELSEEQAEQVAKELREQGNESEEGIREFFKREGHRFTLRSRSRRAS